METTNDRRFADVGAAMDRWLAEHDEPGAAERTARADLPAVDLQVLASTALVLRKYGAEHLARGAAWEFRRLVWESLALAYRTGYRRACDDEPAVSDGWGELERRWRDMGGVVVETAVLRPGAVRALGVPVALLPAWAAAADPDRREALFRVIWREWERMGGESPPAA